jgi:hypothetical protein
MNGARGRGVSQGAEAPPLAAFFGMAEAMPSPKAFMRLLVEIIQRSAVARC